ncbi:restriction endonuclease subunit R [Campylobacter lari]|nr:restriction endonuclease subunit R [Campylobacter lari]
MNPALEKLENDFEKAGGKWKEFKIKDLFERIKTKKLKFSANSLKGRYDEKFNLPALTAGVNNQGLAFYVPRDEATILKNVISVSANGANTGVMFYQPYDFTVLQDSYAIKFKDKKLTDNQYLFFVSCLQKRVRYNFDYSNKAGWEKIKNEIIVIPVYHNEDIAFDFMEDYILQLKIENFHKLKLHLEVCGLLDCKLTEKEKKYFDIISNDNRGG